MSADPTAAQTEQASRIRAEADRIAGAGESSRRRGRDPINTPMINNWVEAIGDDNPIYVDPAAATASPHGGPVAPPAMIQAWTMNGLHGKRAGDDPLGLIMGVLDGEGFTSVVATDCNQTYHRYLRVGEEVSVSTVLDGVVGPKTTGLGEGWFVTTRNIWYVGDEPVAEMEFKVLKFRPGTARTTEKSHPYADIVDTETALRPMVSKDTEFFWDGTKVGELRIQKLADGSLRHPPIPSLHTPRDQPSDYVVASGKGTVFSFVVHHHPKVPGWHTPFVVALVELEEGVRILGQLVRVDPSDVAIGQNVVVDFLTLDDDVTLPIWVLAEGNS